jgi:hypothetical protein
METRDLRRWFDEEELQRCPRCRALTAVTTPRGGFILCFDCGVVGVRVREEQTEKA